MPACQTCKSAPISERVKQHLAPVALSVGLLAFTQVALAAATATPDCPSAATTKATLQLDLKQLGMRVRDTDAIGVLTKLTLKGRIDELVNGMRAFHTGNNDINSNGLFQRYNRLLQELMVLLRDHDGALAHELAGARQPLWCLLANADEFNALIASRN